MSWIKDNPFVAALSGITVVATGALVYFGTYTSGKYSEHLDQYKVDTDKVIEAEKLPIYPNPANSQGKSKALIDYRADLTKLQGDFAPFRPDALKKLSAQDFTGNLKTADSTVRQAFTASNTKLPEAFFLGFEKYKGGALAKEGSTGILDYQLGAATELFLALAKAAPSELKNVYRKELAEESGETFDAKDAVYRPLSMEITFTGTERSVREFLTAIEGSESHYYTIRAIRIKNAKDKGPTPADAKFEAPKAGGAADPFSGFLDPAPAPDGGAAVKPAAVPPDTGKVLQQILGFEELSVFLRLDVVQFLPTKELPKP